MQVLNMIVDHITSLSAKAVNNNYLLHK